MSQLPAISEQLTLAGLQPDDGQELLRIEADEASGRCTARSLDARRELRVAVLEALAQGFGTRTVSKAFKLSREVVRALRAKAEGSGELDHVKKGLAGDAFALARMALDRIRDEIDEMPRSSLPIVAGVMIDKGQLLSGGATQRVEKREGAAVGDVEDYLKSLLNSSAINVSAQPVEEGEKVAQKAFVEVVVGDDSEASGPESSATVDTKSTVICPITEVEDAHGADGGQNSPQKEDAP